MSLQSSALNTRLLAVLVCLTKLRFEYRITRCSRVPPKLRFEHNSNKKTLKQAWRFFLLFNLFVIAPGFEPATVCLEGRCSIQLSYATGFLGRKYTIYEYFTAYSPRKFYLNNIEIVCVVSGKSKC